MVGTDSTASRRSVDHVGSKRRPLPHRSSPARSSTLPVLSSQPTTPGVVSTTPEHSSLFLTLNRQLNASMNFYPPNGLPPHSSRPPSKKSRPSTDDSPTPSFASESTTSIKQEKNKHGIFGLKSKDHHRPTSSHASTAAALPLAGAAPTSPLPARTPAKAAQLLGFDPFLTKTFPEVPHNSDAVRPALMKQASMPLLTKYKDVISKFKEEDASPDPSRPKKFGWGSHSKKALKVMDLLTPTESTTRKASGQERTETLPPSDRFEEVTENSHSSDADLHTRPHPLPVASRPNDHMLSPATLSAPRHPIREIPKRHMRTKVPKTLNRMEPITEASHETLRSQEAMSLIKGRSSEVISSNLVTQSSLKTAANLRPLAEHGSPYATELEVISEYAQDDPIYGASTIPRSRTEPRLSSAKYALDKGTPSPTDHSAEEVENHTILPRTLIDHNRAMGQVASVYNKRSPLQAVEDRLLDAAEVEILRASNNKMKQHLKAFKLPISVHEEPESTEEVSYHEDGEDLLSSGSSISLDEECLAERHAPTSNELLNATSAAAIGTNPPYLSALVVTYAKVPPGVVKLVDIEPKASKPVSLVPQIAATPGETREVYFFKHDERISPFNKQSENFKPRSNPRHLQVENYSRHPLVRKTKMPHDESRLLVQDWIAKNDPSAQRPVSNRIDFDVIADQQIPPAPFPKEDNLPTCSSVTQQKHHCINSGHHFQRVILKDVVDKVAINSLEVQPYLLTNAGVKQHVNISMTCDKCERDVQGVFWQCDVSVCGIVYCRSCAGRPRQTDQKLAITSNTRKTL